jgi:L-lactate utilization protein LutC
MSLDTINYFVANPEPDPNYSHLATPEQLARTILALQTRNFPVEVAEKGADVWELFQKIVPTGTEVFTANSATLQQIGLRQEIDREGSQYDSVRMKLAKLDPKTQQREMVKLGATPQVVIGSVHAVTETGSILIASNTGSQLAPYAAAAAKVVWVVGIQKIVPTLEAGVERIEKYCFPLENQRFQKLYSKPSSINKILIFHKEFMQGRTTIIFVKEIVGF